MRVASLLLLVACQTQKQEMTKSMTISVVIKWPGDATHCAIGDFDGDGKNEIALGNANELRIVTADGKPIITTPITNGLQQLVAADLDGDHRDELYAGWGQTRAHQDGSARVTQYRFADLRLTESTVLEPVTPRQEIAAIVPADDSLLVAYFESKYMVASVLVKPGSPPQPLARLRTAPAYARGDVTHDGKPDIVIGRVYGDDIGIDGDALLLEPRTKIPTTRGVRAIAVVDGDVVMADGWHQNYAKQAKSLVTRAHYENGAFTTSQIDDIAGQYGIEEILPLHASSPAFVTRGTHEVRLYRQNAGTQTWASTRLAGVARDIAVGKLDGNADDQILVLAEESNIVRIQ